MQWIDTIVSHVILPVPLVGGAGYFTLLDDTVGSIRVARSWYVRHRQYLTSCDCHASDLRCIHLALVISKHFFNDVMLIRGRWECRYSTHIPNVLLFKHSGSLLSKALLRRESRRWISCDTRVRTVWILRLGFEQGGLLRYSRLQTVFFVEVGWSQRLLSLDASSKVASLSQDFHVCIELLISVFCAWGIARQFLGGGHAGWGQTRLWCLLGNHPLWILLLHFRFEPICHEVGDIYFTNCGLKSNLLYIIKI